MAWARLRPRGIGSQDKCGVEVDLDGDELKASWLAGRYQVAGLRAQGALCLVYQGQDAVLQRPVAIKAPFAAHADVYRSTLQLTSTLSHPAFLALYDVLEQGNELFLAYEFVEGRPLADYITTGLPLRRALALILQVTRALAYAHAHGVAHGDVTPSAILIDRSAVARVSNVGLPPDDAYFDEIATSAYASGIASDPDTTASVLANHAERLDTWAAAALLWQLITDSDIEKSFLARVRSYRADTPDRLRETLERALRVNHHNAITTTEALAKELAAFDEALAVTDIAGEEPIPTTISALRAIRERADNVPAGAVSIAGMRWRGVGDRSVSPTATTSYGGPGDHPFPQGDPNITHPADEAGYVEAEAPRLRLPSRSGSASDPQLLGARYASSPKMRQRYGETRDSLSGWLWALISLAVFALFFLAGFFLMPVIPLAHLP